MSVTVTSTTDSDKAVTEAQAGLAKESVNDNKSEKGAKASDETPDESETSESEELDESESEESEADPEDEKPEEPKKKKNGFKNRIDKLNKRLTDREREMEYWKAEALKAKTPNQETKPDAAKETPKAAGRPNADDYDSHADYVEAVADWKADAKFAERDQKVAQEKSNADFAETLKNHDARVQSFKESHADYDEVLNESEFMFSPLIQKLILQSDIGPALIYEILTDDELASKISKLSPEFQAREVARLEHRLERNSSEESQETENKTEKSKAPPPIRSLKSNSASASKDPDKMNFQEYKKWHAEKFGRR